MEPESKDKVVEEPVAPLSRQDIEKEIREKEIISKLKKRRGNLMSIS
jgi:hypothetical protein